MSIILQFLNYCVLYLSFLSVFEWKILRRIFAGVNYTFNFKLYQMYEHPDIITNIKIGRLRWAEHVARSENTHKSIRSNTSRNQKKGTPSLRWEDRVEEDARKTVVRPSDWLRKLKDVKAHKALYYYKSE